MKEGQKIVSMVTWLDKIAVATPDCVYAIEPDGSFTPIFTQDDMRRCDKEYAIKKAKEARNNPFINEMRECTINETSDGETK